MVCLSPTPTDGTHSATQMSLETSQGSREVRSMNLKLLNPLDYRVWEGNGQWGTAALLGLMASYVIYTL